MLRQIRSQSSPHDRQLLSRRNTEVTSSYKLNPLSLHPETLAFYSPDDAWTPMGFEDPRSPLIIDAGCRWPTFSSDRQDDGYGTLEDCEFTANDLLSSSIETPTSESVALTESELSYETRGFLSRGSLHVCNPDSSPISPSQAGARLQRPLCADKPQAIGIRRRGAVRFAKPKDPEYDTSVPAVTFSQILRRGDSFPPRPRSRSPKPKNPIDIFGKAIMRAKTALGWRK